MTKALVLDKGYVRLADTNLRNFKMGDDTSVVNAARASYMKETFKLTEKDINLLNYLAKHKHESPYRHATVTIEAKAPLMIARQWFKYRVGWEHGPDTAELLGVAVPTEIADIFWEFMRGIEWMPVGDDQGFGDLLYARNEASRRYVTLEPEWYIPGATDWRSAPENKKQGSGECLDKGIGYNLTAMLRNQIREGIKKYMEVMELGVAPEMARGFLPSMYFLYTVWRWTASLQGVAHFILQRAVYEGAQSEIKEYALATYQLVKPLFPHSLQIEL